MGLNKRKYTIGIRSKFMQITISLEKRKQLFLTGKNSFKLLKPCTFKSTFT